MSQTGTVFDIKRFAIHDGPGIRTTVFLKGCPLSCPWCHNPESQSVAPELFLRPARCIQCGSCVSVCPHDAVVLEKGATVTFRERCELCGACAEACHAEARLIIGREMGVAEVVSEVERDVPFYEQSGGGVTFSGGEPLFQPKFLVAALRACKNRGLHTAVDTCGLADWDTVEGVRSYVDLFLYDLRLMDDGEHERLTGESNATILRNLTLLSEKGERITLRVPVIPGVNDDDANLQELAEFAEKLPNLDEVEILAYHRIGVEKYGRLGREYGLGEIEPPREKQLRNVAQIFRSAGLRVRAGGVVDGDE